jgi:hypothetical protein
MPPSFDEVEGLLSSLHAKNIVAATRTIAGFIQEENMLMVLNPPGRRAHEVMGLTDLRLSRPWPIVAIFY